MQTPRYQMQTDFFTPGQANALLWSAEGKTQLEIATIYSRAPQTIQFYLVQAKEKLGATTVAEAIALCFAKGFMSAKPI
ncbi:helix-turn-helix transcriptional regulator [Endozoicomonas sp. GU-1]|uniref:helix-turn-helix transcriptional regulator n=1 Tax=Endozoicomonas sp. GU-1 TaxID=3009078 RepID=UPI0022B400A0|nr:LuxR C-terminal-related transcriptional regulator [Endozoicomonas sp. GU-1]WBA86508.1 LuxR C-terminal-related transcriptional regulator [Endozoicomonas sp. GU-1]